MSNFLLPYLAISHCLLFPCKAFYTAHTYSASHVGLEYEIRFCLRPFTTVSPHCRTFCLSMRRSGLRLLQDIVCEVV